MMISTSCFLSLSEISSLSCILPCGIDSRYYAICLNAMGNVQRISEVNLVLDASPRGLLGTIKDAQQCSEALYLSVHIDYENCLI